MNVDFSLVRNVIYIFWEIKTAAKLVQSKTVESI